MTIGIDSGAKIIRSLTPANKFDEMGLAFDFGFALNVLTIALLPELG
jgi:hypothetical protein